LDQPNYKEREAQTLPQERSSNEPRAAAWSSELELPVAALAFEDKIDAKSPDDEEMIEIQRIGA
jgi:hypothetical protein